ncbi:MAG: hypothetical protein IPH45_08205 [Bacteroidales bacterium]|nr:hypothetical protein [Bacteroidales bacterium]
MKRKFSSTALFILLCYTLAFSQNDWKSGYIIDLKGDTLSGYIDYRSSASNTERCYFKASEKEKIVIYAPGQIAGYRYKEGKYYISKPIRIDQKDTTLFLEYLIKGKVNIYFAQKDEKRYFAEKDSIFLELKNTKQLKTEDNISYLSNRNEYIGLLTYLMDHADMQDEINSSTLDHKSMIRLARKYHLNVCNDQQCIIYEKKIKKTKMHFGPVYGLNYQALQLNRFQSYFLLNKVSQYAGLEISINNLPGLYERFSLGTEVLIHEYYLENKKKYALNIPVMARYRLSAKKLYPTIEAGFSSYYIRNKHFKAGHFTLSGGLSMYYQGMKHCTLFMQSRYELNPQTFHLGVGLLF